MYNIKDILTMDDNVEYLITSKTHYENIVYYLIININDNSDWYVVFENNNKLEEVTDLNLLNFIMEKFNK